MLSVSVVARVRNAVVGRSLFLLLVVSLALVACGQSTHAKAGRVPTTSQHGVVTKAEWLAKAQQLCDKYNAQIGAIGGGADPASRNAASTAVVGLIRQHVAEARALGYPPGDRATLEPIWNGMDAGLTQVERTGPHANIQQAIGQTLGRWLAKLQAYGTC